ncbi:EAL domain-containing protein [Jannaschia seohaensis]|uniref:EAL domain, c-di-GMP-specific phosphodiesterase class I (Or its enzymatically inactive variant) n=1 Tax=Jannaschia seohaensis TaxID=475081 RepID=A0A2Y9BAC5_9RHOB|nr:EAL domain-containing protein [Jannaschia seohaensis]PWJ12096.1 EAL domain-containing protein (putative c-di-GMP-specific phosphodiesterase class I) [Jannaschia seohaensis]SSA51199.1 EAL domain, c-di-GMP-specific phosphodiesterase class I (or its enzymatically inactive variant) [Jannaschia seohaensis]
MRDLIDRSDWDTTLRLFGRIEDALRRAVPCHAELACMDEGRFLVLLPATPICEATEIVETLRQIGGLALVDDGTGWKTRTLSAGLVQSGQGESRRRAILRCGTEVARARAFGGDRLMREQSRPAATVCPSRDEIEADLASGALRHHVQPIVDLQTGHIAGLEALLRWTRDNARKMAPGEFVDVLDRIPNYMTDLVPRLLDHVAAPLLARPGPFLTINITGAVLDGAGSASCRWLKSVLERVPPDRIVVEIVENAIIARPSRAEELVKNLRAQGVRVALDDFGTGLSNLDRLRTMQVDILKLDRGFVSDLGSTGREETILRNLARMAEELGMSLWAEGIETEAQRQAVADLGIRYGQGYLLGRPGPPEDWAPRLGVPVCLIPGPPCASGRAREARRPANSPAPRRARSRGAPATA